MSEPDANPNPSLCPVDTAAEQDVISPLFREALTQLPYPTGTENLSRELRAALTSGQDLAPWPQQIRKRAALMLPFALLGFCLTYLCLQTFSAPKLDLAVLPSTQTAEEPTDSTFVRSIRAQTAPTLSPLPELRQLPSASAPPAWWRKQTDKNWHTATSDRAGEL